MLEYPNILSISGEGQNVGKTLLAERIIARFSREHDLVALKITQHKHTNTSGARQIDQQGHSVLLEETNPRSNKDTGRMLSAGARFSFLLQTNSDELHDALKMVFARIHNQTLIVCESGEIRNKSITGIHLFVRRLNCQVKNIEKQNIHQLADRIVTFTTNGFDIDLNKISISNHTWKLTE